MTHASREAMIIQVADELTKVLRTPYSGQELVAAIREGSARQGLVELPASIREIWEAGVRADVQNAELAGVQNAIDRTGFLAATWEGKQVSAYLGVNPSTVRHYASDRKLYGFLHRNRLRFPDWQFADGHVIPGLEEILPLMPTDIHPQAVSGFFTSPQPDLQVAGHAATPCQWLLDGHDSHSVAALAKDLGRIL